MSKKNIRTAAELFAWRAKQKHNRKKVVSKTGIIFLTVMAAFFAILFLTPIVLTITNSFMTQSEISSNYGTIFATTDTGGKVYRSNSILRFCLRALSICLSFGIL